MLLHGPAKLPGAHVPGLANSCLCPAKQAASAMCSYNSELGSIPAKDDPQVGNSNPGPRKPERLVESSLAVVSTRHCGSMCSPLAARVC